MTRILKTAFLASIVTLTASVANAHGTLSHDGQGKIIAHYEIVPASATQSEAAGDNKYKPDQWTEGLGVRTIQGFAGPANAKGLALRVLDEFTLDDSPWGGDLIGKNMRVRVFNIEPGGVVPIHSHDRRPAYVVVTKGEAWEFTPQHPEGKLYRVGEVGPEPFGLEHYWINKSDQPVQLYGFDVYERPN